MVDASTTNVFVVLLNGWFSVNILDLRVHCLFGRVLTHLPLIIISKVLLGIYVICSSVYVAQSVF